jgi:hypothetical protein
MDKFSIFVFTMAIWALAMPAQGDAKDKNRSSNRPAPAELMVAYGEATKPEYRKMANTGHDAFGQYIAVRIDRPLRYSPLTSSPTGSLALLCLGNDKVTITTRLPSSAQYHCWHSRCVCVSPKQPQMCLTVRKPADTTHQFKQTARFVFNQC